MQQVEFPRVDLRNAVLVVAAWAALLPANVFGQYEDVSSIVTNTRTAATETRMGVQAPGVGSPGFNVTYSGTSFEVDQIVVASGTYMPVGSGVAYVRRNGATPIYPTSNGEFTTSWNSFVSGPAAPVSGPSGARVVQGEYSSTMDELFTSKNIMTGTENLFVNVDGSDVNVVSDIERVDFVFSEGVVISVDQGFSVFERGRNGGGANGGFKVALITSVDEFGTPTSFSDTIITVSTNSYGPIAGITPFEYDVYRNRVTGSVPPITPGLDYLANPDIGPQGIGGVLLHTDDFGIAVGDTIFGYAVFGLDVAATNGTQLVNWLNPTYYPTTSTTTNDVDMVATGAVIYVPIPEPMAATLLLFGTAGIFLRRRR